MRAFVVADAHGNWSAVAGLLREQAAALVDDFGKLRKNPHVQLIHVGDLANCVEESRDQDAVCLDAAYLFDTLLVGNHEHPYWPGYITKFGGFRYYPEIERRIAKYVETDRYKVATSFGGVLITHAGLNRDFEQVYDETVPAAVVASHLNSIFGVDPAHEYFNRVGRARGGVHPYGGVLWSDWQEAKFPHFTQVFGHTPGKMRVRKYETTPHRSYCIDRGAKSKGSPIGGAWIDLDGKVTPVEYSPTQEGSRC